MAVEGLSLIFPRVSPTAWRVLDRETKAYVATIAQEPVPTEDMTALPTLSVTFGRGGDRYIVGTKEDALDIIAARLYTQYRLSDQRRRASELVRDAAAANATERRKVALALLDLVMAEPTLIGISAD